VSPQLGGLICDLYFVALNAREAVVIPVALEVCVCIFDPCGCTYQILKGWTARADTVQQAESAAAIMWSSSAFLVRFVVPPPPSVDRFRSYGWHPQQPIQLCSVGAAGRVAGGVCGVMQKRRMLFFVAIAFVNVHCVCV
jgi:hypothetical protein